MPSCVDELEQLKAYIRHRVEKWVSEGRQAKELAEKAGMSEGWMSSIRGGEPIGEKKWAALCDAFGMSLREALEASAEWAKTQPKPRHGVHTKLPMSDNLKRAIELLGGVSSAVHEAASAAYVQFDDREVDQWMQWLRNMREAEAAGVLAKRSDTDRALMVATRPRRPIAAAAARGKKPGR